MISIPENDKWSDIVDYRGLIFRSKAEARLAVFCDFLGIGHQPTPNMRRVNLSNGHSYLPDSFLLNVHGVSWRTTGDCLCGTVAHCRVEVKACYPHELKEDDWQKLRSAAEDRSCATILICRAFADIFRPARDRMLPLRIAKIVKTGSADDCFYIDESIAGCPLWFGECHSCGQVFLKQIGWQDDCYHSHRLGCDRPLDFRSTRLIAAYRRARTYPFKVIGQIKWQ